MKRKVLPKYYIVESIQNKRINQSTNQIEYEVKWVDWDHKFNTWQPIQNLKYVQSMVQQFDQKFAKQIAILQQQTKDKNIQQQYIKPIRKKIKLDKQYNPNLKQSKLDQFFNNKTNLIKMGGAVQTVVQNKSKENQKKQELLMNFEPIKLDNIDLIQDTKLQKHKKVLQDTQLQLQQKIKLPEPQQNSCRILPSIQINYQIQNNATDLNLHGQQIQIQQNGPQICNIIKNQNSNIQQLQKQTPTTEPINQITPQKNEVITLTKMRINQTKIIDTYFDMGKFYYKIKFDDDTSVWLQKIQLLKYNPKLLLMLMIQNI